MRKFLIASLAITTFGLAACSDRAQQESNDAGTVVVVDSAQTDHTISNDAERLGESISTGASNAADKAAQVATDAGYVIEGTVNAAGAAAARAGESIKQETEKAKAGE